MAFAEGGTVQARAGYFYFANHAAREIYHTGTPDVEIEGSLSINRRFTPWMNINYVWKEGRSEALSDKTELKMGTLSLGVKRYFERKFYLGLGLSAAYLHLEDDSPYLPKTTRRWGAGVVGKSGWLIQLNKCLFLDLFFDYYYQPMHARSSLSTHHVDVGGFRTGGGIGSRF
jgi:hypothetical protein